jgi:multidrug resistance efflux pump
MNTPEKKESLFTRKPWILSLIYIVVIFALLGGFLFWQSSRGRVHIENATLVAPIVNLAAVAPGTLNALYVHDGEQIPPNTEVALVGTSIVTSKEEGIVSSTPNVLGGYYAPGTPIVSVIKVNGMKVVGSIEETKGLKNISVGQRAQFTVDAFPGKKYIGVVDEVSPTSNDTGVVFAISDKRPIKKFDIKVRFDIAKYPELKNGMSAKITVFTR